MPLLILGPHHGSRLNYIFVPPFTRIVLRRILSLCLYETSHIRNPKVHACAWEVFNSDCKRNCLRTPKKRMGDTDTCVFQIMADLTQCRACYESLWYTGRSHSSCAFGLEHNHRVPMRIYLFAEPDLKGTGCSRNIRLFTKQATSTPRTTSADRYHVAQRKTHLRSCDADVSPVGMTLASR